MPIMASDSGSPAKPTLPVQQLTILGKTFLLTRFPRQRCSYPSSQASALPAKLMLGNPAGHFSYEAGRREFVFQRRDWTGQDAREGNAMGR
jgi:hypothetical protein